VRADAVLLDIDGVLVVAWDAIPGATDTLAWLREHDLPFRLITNTTTHTRAGLSETLGSAGLAVDPSEIVTAVTATASYLEVRHPGAAVFVLTDGDPGADLGDVRRVDAPEDADVLVVGGANEDFGYDVLNRMFRRLMDGAALVGMHRNLYWRTGAGWQLDSGAFLTGLERASGVEAAICGKPAAPFFEAATRVMDVAPTRAAMVGDDVVNDVNGAQALGIAGVLVRTGKFQPDDASKGPPDAVLDSIADLPGWLEGSA
jgi:HAD superfamily hydrolase (TIGR01458 family)